MSIRAPGGPKLELERPPLNVFWETIQRDYAGANRFRWRSLAMLVLREEGNWTLERIAAVFGISIGHVSRNLRETKQELAGVLENRPKWRFRDEEPFASSE